MKHKVMLLTNHIDHAKILDEASDPLATLNSHYQFTYANKALAKALGKTLEVIIGNDLWEIYSKDGADMRRDAIKEVFATGQTKVIETIVPKPSGNLYFITTFKPIFNEKNIVISVVAIAKEITDRKQAEEKLQESEANYRQLFDNAPSGIYQVDFRTGKLIKANDVFCEYFGCSQEEITSISPYDIMTEESKKRFFERLNKMVLGEEVPENPEYEVIDRDGKGVWVKLTTKYNYDSEGLAGANVVVHDIDDLKRAEAALRESELWYRMIYNNAPLGIIHFDSSGSIMDFNDNFAKIMGAPREKLLGFNMLEELRDQAMLEAVNNALSGQSGYYEGEYTSVTGQHKRFQRAIFQTLKGDDGMFIGAVGIFEDITERKQAEEAVAASLREKETMLKEIHHRVKNNLQVISSLLGLQSSCLQDEKSRAIFQESQERVRVMANIHTMLYQSADLARVDFGGFIRDLADRLQQSYGLSGSSIEINADIADVSMAIETSIPCGLILNELMSNTLKHAFPEGRAGEVTVSMKTAGDRFELKVQDNGIGLPESVDFKHPQSLGLELVRLLAEQIGGKIDLQVEGGTTFTITFPATDKRG